MHADPLVASGLPFRVDDAHLFALTPRRLSELVRRGVLRRPLRRVYVDARVPDTRDLRIHCLALVIPPYAVVWGRTAAWLWGLDTFAPGERELLTPECVVPHHSARMKSPGVRVVEGTVPDSDVAAFGGLRVTKPTRTAVDLALRLSRPMALAALDAFTHVGLVTPDELHAAMDPLAGYRGIVQARELLILVEPLTESPGESWLRLRIVDAGFPHPRPQVELVDATGRVVYRIDLGYDEIRLGLEYDGEDFHGFDRQHDDEARRAACKREWDWDVRGFGRGEVLGRSPGLELAIGDWLGIEPRLPRRW